MTPQETERLILLLLDREISELEFVLLEEELSLHEESRQMFRDFVFLHSELSGMTHPQPALKRQDLMQRLQKHLQSESEQAVKTSRKKTLQLSLACAAVISILLSLGLYFTRIETPPKQLTLTSAPDSHFTVSGTSPEHPEERLPVGASVELSQGTLQIDFENGVRSIISAPAHLTRSATNKLDLHEGTAWFRVPKEGIGFQVQTAGLLITDLGTEFGIIHVPGSTDEIHVFQGSVEARALSGMKSREQLTAGQSRLVNVRGELQAAPKLSSPFTKALPDRLPHLHFPFDDIKRGETPVRGQHPALAELTTSLIQSDDRSPVFRLGSGRFGNALEFDGKGDFLKTNWPGVFGSQPVTVSFWVKPKGHSNFAGIVSWGTGKTITAESNQWKLVITPEQASPLGQLFRCSWGTSKLLDIPVTIPRDEWTHLAVVYTGESSGKKPALHFYINGIEHLPATQKIPTPPRRPADLATAQNLMFGHPHDWPEDDPTFYHSFYRGSLDEVFIIEGALTQEQITRLYQENTYKP